MKKILILLLRLLIILAIYTIIFPIALIAVLFVFIWSFNKKELYTLLKDLRNIFFTKNGILEPEDQIKYGSLWNYIINKYA